MSAIKYGLQNKAALMFNTLMISDDFYLSNKSVLNFMALCVTQDSYLEGQF